MPIDQAISLPVALAEAAVEQAGVIRVAGGQVRHEVRTGTGRGALLSAAGLVRVGHEGLRVEALGAGSQWHAVGGLWRVPIPEGAARE